MPYYDLRNDVEDREQADSNNDWNVTGRTVRYGRAYGAPFPLGKLWLLSYITGRDPNSGPYPEATIWYDNLLIATGRLPDPGVKLQPPTGLTISKAAYPLITLSWTRNKASDGNPHETGFVVQRCPGQLFDCQAQGLVPGLSWSDAGTTAAGTTTFTETAPNAGRVYTYRVLAVIGGARSTWSNAVTTVPDPPYDAEARWVGGNVVLNWTQADDIGMFAVQRCSGVFQYNRLDYNGLGQYADDPKCLAAGSSERLPMATIPFSDVAKGIVGSKKGAQVSWTDTKAATACNPYCTYRVRAYTRAGSLRHWNAGAADRVAYSANVVPQAPAKSGATR